MEHKIKTDRLYLQPLTEFDIGFIQELLTRPESFRYDRNIAHTGDKINEQCRWYMERIKVLPNEGAIQWIVISGDAKIGEVHVTCNWEETLEWEIGWHLLFEHWGKGFATESTQAIIQYSFTHFNVNRLVAFLNAENERSACLAERVGMVKEGRLRETRLVNGVYYDELVYSILKSEFSTTV